MTADELVRRAEACGMRFSYALREGMSAVTPLIRADGSRPPADSEAIFAEVRRRWDECEQAVAQRVLTKRFPGHADPCG
jgi:hypothetical protein